MCGPYWKAEQVQDLTYRMSRYNEPNETEPELEYISEDEIEELFAKTGKILSQRGHGRGGLSCRGGYLLVRDAKFQE